MSKGTWILSHPWEATPIDLSFEKFAKFKRLSVLPGVSLQKLDGPLAASISVSDARLPVRPDIWAQHVLVVNKAQYLRGLDRRLAIEGKCREIDWVDIDGIKLFPTRLLPKIQPKSLIRKEKLFRTR